jgi:hypothetical protein
MFVILRRGTLTPILTRFKSLKRPWVILIYTDWPRPMQDGRCVLRGDMENVSVVDATMAL